MSFFFVIALAMGIEGTIYITDMEHQAVIVEPTGE